MTWIEVGSNVFVKRYELDDLNVAAIPGPSGVTVVDTGGSSAQAQEIIADIKDEFGLPIVAAINTHAHYDHTFGNCVFAELGIPIVGHHRIPAHYAEYEAPRLAAWRSEPAREPDKDWGKVVLTEPTELVREAGSLAHGGREIRLLPVPRGHTDTDLAVFVPDARVWLLGDVVEESGPPMFGSGSWPLDWPAALQGLLAQLMPDDVVIPGHGRPVGREFVERQADSLNLIASVIRHAWDAGLDFGQSLGAAELPWPEWMLRSAFEQGFSQLALQLPGGPLAPGDS